MTPKFASSIVWTILQYLTALFLYAAASAQAASPTAVDVYAATPVSTPGNPQSTLVVLEGADADADALSYSLLSMPAHGVLLDRG